jgi:hypothetical protein
MDLLNRVHHRANNRCLPMVDSPVQTMADIMDHGLRTDQLQVGTLEHTVDQVTFLLDIQAIREDNNTAGAIQYRLIHNSNNNNNNLE